MAGHKSEGARDILLKYKDPQAVPQCSDHEIKVLEKYVEFGIVKVVRLNDSGATEAALTDTGKKLLGVA